MNKIRYNEPKHLKYITENRGSHSLGTQNYLLLQETIRCLSFFNDNLTQKQTNKKKRCTSLFRSAREFSCINISLFCLIKVAEREGHGHRETRTRLRKVVWCALQKSVFWILASREQGKKLTALELDIIKYLFHTATRYTGLSSYTWSFLL